MGVPQNGWFIKKNPIKMAASTYGNSQYEPRVKPRHIYLNHIHL